MSDEDDSLQTVTVLVPGAVRVHDCQRSVGNDENNTSVSTAVPPAHTVTFSSGDCEVDRHGKSAAASGVSLSENVLKLIWAPRTSNWAAHPKYFQSASMYPATDTPSLTAADGVSALACCNTVYPDGTRAVFPKKTITSQPLESTSAPSFTI